jgi:hypothetical protein
MKYRIMISGAVLLTLLCTTGIVTAQAGPPAYAPGIGMTENRTLNDNNIGAGNALYGLKIAMEDLDESFTFNQTQRLEKRMIHANLRINEAEQELAMNRTQYAERALDLYMQKLNLTETELAGFPANTTGLLHAQEMIGKHEQVLAGLMLSHPNNTGLVRAHMNSLTLGQKFEEKNAIRLGRTAGQGNVTPPGANRVALQEGNRTGNGNGGQIQTGEMTRNNQQDQSPRSTDTTIVPATILPQDNRGASGNQGKQNGNGNMDGGGQGKSQGK